MPKKNILVVASDHDIRVEIRQHLEAEGHFVVSVANGSDALAILDKISRPSLILISSPLPLISAEQLIQILRSYPNFIDIPIVQMKAAEDLELPNTCCIIAKPIDHIELLDCVRNCSSS